MTINELIQVAHADAKAKGWWDEPRNTGELLMLIVSECGEALEAHRSGKRAKMDSIDYNIKKMGWDWMTSARVENIDGTMSDDAPFKRIFETDIKDTFEDELADIVIRIADWMGHKKWVDTGFAPELVYVHGSENVGENLWSLNKILCGNGDEDAETSSLFCIQAVVHAFYMAKVYNIDLWRHIELKLAYNRTRPHKHGKAY